ncbi:hypothetical protein [Xenorhabdus bovienii]|uniref:Uncharacterized protein n=1 Tax=Xenorhabdus bovienii TaxID=40576 RepID=A0A0B6X2F2_XENBV|nr:hypothetical protein [Xenorhabdus bovienii]CDM87942.1 conserved exported protein of unknown function [Xenorhabdus bovienii]
MHLLTQILLFSFISLMSSPSIAHLSTQAEILQQVRERGVNAVVAELGEIRKRDEVAHNITTGERQWLEVAFTLFPNIHSEFSKQILRSLSFALINNPVEVLSLSKEHNYFSSDQICNIPSTLKGLDARTQFIKKVSNRLNAARKANSGKNKENIENCLWELEQVL